MSDEPSPTPQPDDVCARPDRPVPQTTRPLSPAIYPTSVWICNDTQQADELLDGTATGYVYQRNGHPNADALAEKIAELHAADRAAVTSSGMAALSLALLSQVETGDHLVVSDQLYGHSLKLMTDESARLGIRSTTVDACDAAAVADAFTERTRLLVVETIANPRLRVADIAALAEIAHQRNARLLVDNTFATPIGCRPLELGADLVMESASKLINGHSDVMLGLLCGRADAWQRVPETVSVWGLASSPFDCWLALRGLASLHLRVERAFANAQAAAELLAERPEVEAVDYPGLPDHPDHAAARRQFGDRFGAIVTFRLAGGRAAADAFIAAARRIPFCPSLGEISTTLSHPESTSHRGLAPEARAQLGIAGGTIRLSVGVESPEFVRSALLEALTSAALEAPER